MTIEVQSKNYVILSNAKNPDKTAEHRNNHRTQQVYVHPHASPV